MTQQPEFERFCIFCGKRFMATRPYQENCSTKCQMRSWRARGKLAGTHGYINHQWRRLPGPK
jgi:predicted nucleic acid-binding Zn ribbon protein